ncbi:hypothetical protein CYMTET_13423 [Cymbomonas tetramitiformis]|uniref:RCC1-like domain-containing protein n=1 Tax=Cymbomonas tetramitiformis TaxID=36881 RepID=A0AAE0LB74_9CHLO|nr:hypothetical protein CYMTET_13423 [Cymbomonas tetramitiformis]
MRDPNAGGYNEAVCCGGQDYSSPALLPPFADGKVVTISAGFAHSGAITDSAKLYMWGDNTNGQLGLLTVDTKPSHIPKSVMPSIHFALLACGRGFTLAVTQSGKTYAWGANMHGQLGMGDMAPRSNPQLITRLNGHKMVRVTAGGGSAIVVTEMGELFGWGRNNVGQLGIPRSKSPKVIPEFILSSHDSSAIDQVVAGGYAYQYEGHSMVLTSSGEVHSWGWNAFGQLGIGEVDEGHSIPHKNSWLLKTRVKMIAAGQFASAAVTEAGEVLTWGQNDAGQLGRGDFTSGPVDIPQRIHLEGAILQVTIGYSHMLALSVEGKVYSWGHNFYGQLGVGDHKDKATAQGVSYLQEERIKQVVAGQYHSLAVSVKGELYGWGYNRDYELGVGDNMDRVLPQVVPTLTGHKVATVAAGGYHSLAVCEDGMLYSWGMNNYGQLGHRERSTSKVPTAVTVTTSLADGKQVGKRLRLKQVAAGTWHSLALAEDNHVYAFGRCQHGQLGVRCQKGGERVQDVFLPERVSDHLEDKKVVSIAAGAAHSFALVEVKVK